MSETQSSHAALGEKSFPRPDQRGSRRVAIVDGDSAFVTVTGKRLEAAQWEYRVLASGVPIDELLALKLSAILIDPAALGPRFWEFVEAVAGALPDLGIVVCASKSSVAQRVRGLRLGADDWISKPCHPEEVVARLSAVVRRRRRSAPKIEAGPVVVGEVEIREDRFQAFVGGESLELTRREFELLALLVSSPGSVIEREDIYQQVWGYAMAHGDRSVDVFVRKLRLKLQRLSPGWNYIHTHFGIGYRFDPEPVVSQEGIAESRPSSSGSETDFEDTVSP